MKKTFWIAIGLAAFLMSNTAIAKPLVYVAAGSANKILVIDAVTDKVVGGYDDIDNPHSIVSTPDGEYIISGSLKEKSQGQGTENLKHSTIYLVHPQHGHVMLTMTAEGMIHHQAITPDGRFVISTHPTRGNISLADLEKNKVTKTVKTGRSPNYAIVSSDGKMAYISNSGDGTISEINITTWTEERVLKAGAGPEHMVQSKDGKTIYVVNSGVGTVSAVDIVSGEVVRTYQFDKRLHGLDISDDGQTLFVSSKKEEKFIAFDPKTDTRRVLQLSPSPYHLEAIRGTGKIYLSSSTSPKIWVIDQKTAQIIREIEIEGEGHQMTLVK